MEIGIGDGPRKTGRTTRMVKAALKYALENDTHAYVVLRAMYDWTWIRSELHIGPDAEGNIRLRTPGSSDVCMRTLTIRGLRANDLSVFFDHSIVWSHHRNAIEEWARFAPRHDKDDVDHIEELMQRVDSADCRAFDAITMADYYRGPECEQVYCVLNMPEVSEAGQDATQRDAEVPPRQGLE